MFACGHTWVCVWAHNMFCVNVLFAGVKVCITVPRSLHGILPVPRWQYTSCIEEIAGSYPISKCHELVAVALKKQ